MKLAPLWGAGLRFALAAALLAVMAMSRLTFPRGRAVTGLLLYGLFNFGASFALIYYGLVLSGLILLRRRSAGQPP